MKNILITFITIGVTFCNVHSQNKNIKGRVISEDYETLPGVLIIINDTLEVARTDMDGYFQADIPISEKKISFKAVGLESTSIELINNCDKIEVVIMYSYSYDFISLKRAEKKRKKRYKKLADIHKQAFNKNLFETEFSCYIRRYEPFYLQEN